MTHSPSFDLKTRGGVTAGPEWIHDGDQPIAELQHVEVEQPEQNLRYFNKNTRPILLRSLSLAPHQKPLVDGVHLYWVLGRDIITSDVVDVSVEGRGSGHLRLTVITADPGGVATSRRIIDITYDEEDGSYVYEFACHLELHAPETFDLPGVESHSFEYSDPWFTDIPAPTIEFDGAWSGRGYDRLLAQSTDGSAWQMPLNHLATGITRPEQFAADSYFVLADATDTVPSPAFQFVGASAARTRVGVCNWGYDIHLAGQYSRDELYSDISERFRVRLCPPPVVQKMRQTAPRPPAVEFGGFDELPAYERLSSFSRGQKLNESAGDPGPWPWLPQGEGADWCHDTGRSDDHSLKIERERSGVSLWSMDREGEGAFTQRWRQSTGLRVSVWVKTRDLVGRGACLGLRWIIFNVPERHPIRVTDYVRGDADWTQLRLEITGPPPPEASAVEISLRQDGLGSSWFDDIEVEVL